MLHLTPAMLEAAYELLRVTPPFKRWRLPDPDDVEFIVKRVKNGVAEYHYTYSLANEPHHAIVVCHAGNKSMAHLMESMAHEMAHMHQRTTVDRQVMRRSAMHGAKFKHLAAQVCRAHGFDVATF